MHPDKTASPFTLKATISIRSMSNHWLSSRALTKINIKVKSEGGRERAAPAAEFRFLDVNSEHPGQVVEGKRG
jgi:hypothetical protein